MRPKRSLGPPPNTKSKRLHLQPSEQQSQVPTSIAETMQPAIAQTMQPTIDQTTLMPPPPTVLPHLFAELQYPSTERSVLEMQTKKYGRSVTKRRKLFRVFGLSPSTSASNTIGVPPAPNPKKMLPRARSHERLRSPDFFLDQCTLLLEQERNPTLRSIAIKMQQVQQQSSQPVPDADIYDFLHAELRFNTEGELLPYGELPGKNGTCGFHQFRIQHALVYLMKRKLLWIFRPGFFLTFFFHLLVFV
jgi:hypothetical protein